MRYRACTLPVTCECDLDHVSSLLDLGTQSENMSRNRVKGTDMDTNAIATITTVGPYIAGVETVAYREWVTARQELVAAGDNAPADLQERERFTFLAAQRAAVAYETRK